MKKLLSFILILAMLTVAMVSCKKDDPTEDPATNNPPAQETRYTITAEEWAAVCALTNFTATQAGSAVYTSDGVTDTEETFAEYKYTATATYHKVQETGDPIYEEYYALIDGRILNIRLLSSGAFEADVTDRTELDNFAEAFEFDGVTFDTLTYNAEAKAYVLDLSDEDMEMVTNLPLQYFLPEPLGNPVIMPLMPMGKNYYVPAQSFAEFYKGLQQFYGVSIKDVLVTANDSEVTVIIKYA